MPRQHQPQLSRTRVLISSLTLTVMTCAVSATFAADIAPQWVKGRLLVQPRAGVTADQLDTILKPHGGKSNRHIHQLNIHVVDLPANASEKAVANFLKKHPHIKFAEPDLLLPTNVTANDTYASSAWHLDKMQAPTAWTASQGSGITVAVLDTGVDSTHPDLSGQLVPGWNMYDNNADTSDVYGHGTMVAGVVAAASNNGVGVTSLAWNAKVMPVRISDPTGMGSISTIADGLIYAADHGAKVANVSYAISGYATTQSAAQYMKNKGGVTVVSAGNTGAVDATAANDTMITVSATDSNDALAGWSTFGPVVDVSAPGVGIWTTTRGGGYGAPSGTSFASPATAGTVALMMAANSQLTPANIESLIKSTAVDLGTAGWDPYYGAGRVNAGAAVLAAATAQSRDTTAPSAAIAAPAGSAIVSGLVPVDVSAFDDVGVTRVDLVVNGAPVASDTSAPFAFSWDSTKVADGKATMIAYAYDAAGNYAGSAVVNVTVKNTVDTTAPGVTISSPVNGSKLTRSVTISAKATDNVSVTSSSLYIDGKLTTTVAGGNLSYNWNTNKVAAGTHTIMVKAIDSSGNTTTTSVQVSK
jgi:thermitase